jgi:hypothetical protein
VVKSGFYDLLPTIYHILKFSFVASCFIGKNRLSSGGEVMSRDALGFGAVKTRRSVFALVADMKAATQIVKCAAGLHVGVRNFDNAEKLVAQAAIERPFLVILDLEKREAEAFRTLNELHKNADLKGILRWALSRRKR